MTITTGYIGIDAAKTFHKICIKNQHKRTLIPIFEIEDSADGFDALRSTMDALKEQHQLSMFMVGIESTGTYHVHLLDWLRQQADVIASLLNPLQTHHYLRSDMRRASTDSVSAELIAQFMVERTPKPTKFVGMDYETVKRLASHLHGLTKQKSATMNRLRELVSLQWPSFERTFHNFNAKQVLALLTVVQTPKEFLTYSPDSLKHVTVLGTSYTLRSNFLKTVTTLAEHERTTITSLQPAYIIRSLAEQVMFFLQQIDQVTEELKRTFANTTDQEVPLLATINGVGTVSAMVFTAAIGDPHRFSSTKQIVSYFGLSPRIKQSGTSVVGRGYVQKKGSPLIRFYLFNCVLSMIRNPKHPIGVFYKRLVDEGKEKMVAIIACMRKLAILMLAILQSNTPFHFQSQLPV